MVVESVYLHLLALKSLHNALIYWFENVLERETSKIYYLIFQLVFVTVSDYFFITSKNEICIGVAIVSFTGTLYEYIQYDNLLRYYYKKDISRIRNI